LTWFKTVKIDRAVNSDLVRAGKIGRALYLHHPSIKKKIETLIYSMDSKMSLPSEFQQHQKEFFVSSLMGSEESLMVNTVMSIFRECQVDS